MKKISVQDLEMGMKVVKLDRAWIDTPFVRHKFLLRKESQIAWIKENCKHVYVDVVKKKIKDQQGGLHDRIAIDNKREMGQRQCDSREMDSVRSILQLRERTVDSIEIIFSDIKMGRAVEVRRIKEVVGELITNVLDNSLSLALFEKIDSRSPSLAHKSLNVCVFSLAFAKYLGLPNKKLMELGMGALLHDIGMLLIPDSIFSKRDKYTDYERGQMQTHCELGAQLVQRQQEISSRVIGIIANHHERVDGQGYPERKALTQLNLDERLVSIVSCYEGMTRSKPYAKALTPAAALRSIFLLRGTHFDEKLVVKFIRMLGIFPPGSVLRLKDDRVGMVLDRKEQCFNLLMVGYYPDQWWDRPRVESLASLQVAQVMSPDDPLLEQLRQKLNHCWANSA